MITSGRDVLIGNKGADCISLEVGQSRYHGWCNTDIEVRCYGWTGRFNGNSMKSELGLADEVRKLYRDLSGTALWNSRFNFALIRINIAIFALALLTIAGGLHAVAAEHRRTRKFLESKYQQLNRTVFDNSLPPVRIEWADLTEYNRQGETYRERDGTFIVLVDVKTNLRDEDLQDTVSHEMCHVATWRKEDDPHGLAFRACMDVIKGKVLQNGRMKAQ